MGNEVGISVGNDVGIPVGNVAEKVTLNKNKVRERTCRINVEIRWSKFLGKQDENRDGVFII